MADKVITKYCGHCKTIKSTKEFGISRFNTSKDKLQTYCKTCNSLYRKTPQYREHQRRYNKTEKGKKICAIASKKYYKKYPERLKAKNAVAHAIRYYGFPKPSKLKCVLCNGEAQDYHHPSYAPEHWLDVEPVCKICHKKIHTIVPFSQSEPPDIELSPEVVHLY